MKPVATSPANCSKLLTSGDMVLVPYRSGSDMDGTIIAGSPADFGALRGRGET
jgi:hypothetical protein